jgi:hypothetical protein
VPLPRVEAPVAPPGVNLPTPTTAVLPHVESDPPPSVHSAPVIENSSADAPLPRVDNDIAPKSDPTYITQTINAGKRRRQKAKTKK